MKIRKHVATSRLFGFLWPYCGIGEKTLPRKDSIAFCHGFLSKPPSQVLRRWVKPYDASFGGDGVHWGTRGTIYSNYFDVHWGTRALMALSGEVSSFPAMIAELQVGSR